MTTANLRRRGGLCDYRVFGACVRTAAGAAGGFGEGANEGQIYWQEGHLSNLYG